MENESNAKNGSLHQGGSGTRGRRETGQSSGRDLPRYPENLRGALGGAIELDRKGIGLLFAGAAFEAFQDFLGGEEAGSSLGAGFSTADQRFA